jgi:serine phosphatase RsbU (regulator of sigma subunit)
MVVPALPPHERNMSDDAGQRGSGLTFRTKLLLSVCGVVLLTGAVVLLVADRSGRASTRMLVDSLFREVSGHAVTQTKDFILRAAPVAESLEQLADQGLALDDLDKLAPQLLAFLKGNPGMTRVLYGDEGGGHVAAARLRDGRLHIERTRTAGGAAQQTEYEVQRDGTWAVVRQDDNSGYDPRARPFYILAKDKGRLAWTPPYMFFSQGVPGISCVIPVKRPSGPLRGVFSVEFDLNALSEFVSALAVSPHSRVFLFTPDQTLLAHPNQRTLVGTGVKGAGAMLTLAETGDPLVDAFRQHLRPEYLRNSSAGAFHFFEFDHEGTGYLASTTVFPIGDGQSWVVGAVAPQSDFLAAVWRTRLLSLAAAAGALGIAALLSAALARHISNPVQALIGFVRRVGGGDLEAKADFHGGREFRELSAALNRMIVDLRERLHLRHSLHVAMEVQKSLLPASDPISPRLDIAGRSKYCDETGGDYYDFIEVSPVSKSSLMIAVGDVMGHGVPAALVMATVRAALRTSALDDRRLADLMTRTNHVLAADNRHNRFVTLSLLLIEADTRIVRWASAGHDPAIVYDPRTDSSRELEGGDVPLGVMDAVEYEEFTTNALAADSVIIIGTDGVWEMLNERQEQYGKERMQRVVREHHARPAAQIAAALEADLAAFRGAQNPADDVTFVIVKFRP